MRLFISYRRADAQLTARAMKTFLDGIPAVTEVFLDFDEIEIGSDFEQSINRALAKSDACLVLIGGAYTTGGLDAGTPRIFDPEDFVRREAALALSSGTKVVPVLVDGAPMPNASDLPEDLRELPKLNAFQLRTSHFNADMDDLLDVLFGKAARKGSRWTRAPLTVLGGVKRLMGGAVVGLIALMAVLIAVNLIRPMECGSLNCVVQKQFFATEPTIAGAYARAQEVLVPAYAGFIALFAAAPFAWRWMRR